MADETPWEPRFAVWQCEHCRQAIKFDVVQLAGRNQCRVTCPSCGWETNLQEPPPPPPLLVLDEGWTQPSSAGTAEMPVADKPVVGPATAAAETAPWLEPTPPPVAAQPKSRPAEPEAITVSLPPDPPPPVLTRAPVDVRWVTDLGVAYFRQHQFRDAFQCFSRAAEQGFATAEFCLAVCYLNGQGAAQDDAVALSWLQKAAAQGDANAEFTLGMAYRLGRGVTVDPVRALQWLGQAADRGHSEARKCIAESSVAGTGAAETGEVGTGVAGTSVAGPGVVGPGVVETAPTFASLLQKASGVPPPDSVPPHAGGEKSADKPRPDLQSLLFGLFRKK